MLKNNAKWMLIVIFLFGFYLTSLSQEASNKAKSGEGLISAGSNKFPAGPLGVTTYRLERIDLGSKTDLLDGKEPTEFAYRLAIQTEKDLPSAAWSIWFGDQQLSGSAVGQRSVVTIIAKRTLPDGVVLGLSKFGENTLAERSILPERLNVPSEFATPLDEIEASKPVITLKRIPGKVTLIELGIKIPGKTCTANTNMGIVLVIGENEYGAGCYNNVIFRRFTEQEFTDLRDGAEIAVQSGFGADATGRNAVGNLNKSALQETSKN